MINSPLAAAVAGPLVPAEAPLLLYTGLGLVVVALVVLCLGFKRLAAQLDAVQAKLAQLDQPTKIIPVPVAPAISRPAVALVVADDISPELLGVIAAAVQLALRDAHRIHAIIPVKAQDWAHEGRRQIFASHQVR